MHRYTVELRVSGLNLDPDEVTKTLGLSPSQVRRKGERRGENFSCTTNIWAFEVLPPDGCDWPSLEEALSAMLAAVGPIRSKLQSYSPTNDICLWCGHFTSSFDGGPTLSPALLKSLADFGIELFLDTYCTR